MAACRHMTRRPLKHALARLLCSSSKTSSAHVPKVAVVGSGPAGFYTAQQILKGHSTVHVDVYEKLPVPFGLVRYGVAPDHPEVKNVINTFTQTAGNDRCSYLGNVSVGRDISVSELRSTYNAVVLSYGSDDDRTLGIPGEDKEGVLSARSFVGWYNGLPEERALEVDLDTDTAVVLGQGNVAIDVARILVTPIDILRKTDMTEYALEALSRSRVKRVVLVGRRGPLQVSFTTAEVREMIRLEGCRPILHADDFLPYRDGIQDLKRARRRLSELLIKTALDKPIDEDAARWANANKEWELKFLRSPLEVLSAPGTDSVSAIRLGINCLEGDEVATQKAVPTGETEETGCGLVLRSIGYKSVPIDPDVPFDASRAVIPNIKGRVLGEKGLYCSGWVKRGPIGVIVSTMTDGFETGKVIVHDLNKEPPTETAPGKDTVLDLLSKKGIQHVSFRDWQQIDREEEVRGSALGKPREKIVVVDEMMSVLRQ